MKVEIKDDVYVEDEWREGVCVVYVEVCLLWKGGLVMVVDCRCGVGSGEVVLVKDLMNVCLF